MPAFEKALVKMAIEDAHKYAETGITDNNSSLFTTIVMTFLLALILTGTACSQKSTGWKGRIEKEGDVVVVNNPNEPMYGPEVISLEEDLSIGANEGSDYLFADISSIAVGPDGTIFVLDQRDRNVKVFDPAGKWIRTFGKSGQGPGELSRPRSINFLGPDELVVFDIARRFEFFKPNGDHVHTLSAASLSLIDARPDSAGNFFIYIMNREETNPRYELRKVDGELKDLFVLESSPLSNSARDGFNPFFPVLRWARLSADRVVCGYAAKYELRIYDAEGQIVRKIQMNQDQVPIAKEDIEERTKGTPPDLLANMKIPRYYPEFRYILTDDKDRIWVLCWDRPLDRKGFYFDVFDPEGRYIVRAVLPVIQPLIYDEHIYAVEETEEGYPLLKRYKVGWNL